MTKSLTEEEVLIERLRTCAEQSEMGRNFAGTPQACRAAADRLSAYAVREKELLNTIEAANIVIAYSAERLWNGRPDAIRDRPVVIDAALRTVSAALRKGEDRG